MRLCITFLILLLCACGAHADEPFFKPSDVVAFIGGEDLVVASEHGYLEMLLHRALPGHRLKFRSLAWEGDTVFEQRRDLNFPNWDEQLAQVGATVVVCQFGQMESCRGPDKLPAFIEAYEKLLRQWSNGGKRRLIVLEPFGFGQRDEMPPPEQRAWELSAILRERHDSRSAYSTAAHDVAERVGAVWAPIGEVHLRGGAVQRDGCHLTRGAQAVVALDLARKLDLEAPSGTAKSALNTRLLALIATKNRLWFDYWRVQNWAFLAGDRTVQPSSRDHLDPSKRWFPAEREEFLPLIEAKEREIWKLASELSKP